MGIQQIHSLGRQRKCPIEHRVPLFTRTGHPSLRLTIVSASRFGRRIATTLVNSRVQFGDALAIEKPDEVSLHEHAAFVGQSHELLSTV